MTGDSAQRVCAALTAGRAVVVPNPAPMAYGVVATTAHAVNALKRRPIDQNVGISVHDRSQWEEIAPRVDLPPAAMDAVAALLHRRFTLLVPVRDDIRPAQWLLPAIRDGYLAIFDGRWSATAWLWDGFPRLYGSSANLTGVPPVSSAQGAADMFGADCLVARADEPDEPDAPGQRWSSTMLRVGTDGRLRLHRSGAQDRIVGLSPEVFLRQLADSVGIGRR